MYIHKHIIVFVVLCLENNIFCDVYVHSSIIHGDNLTYKHFSI